MGLLGVVSYWIWVLCFFDCVLQWGNIASSKRACVDVKIVLFGDCINIWLCSFLIAIPRYVINLDFRASLFIQTSEGMWTYAPQLKTQRLRYLKSQIAITHMECVNSITSLESSYIRGQHVGWQIPNSWAKCRPYGTLPQLCPLWCTWIFPYVHFVGGYVEHFAGF